MWSPGNYAIYEAESPGAVMSLKRGRAALRRSMSARSILEHSLEREVLGLEVNVLT